MTSRRRIAGLPLPSSGRLMNCRSAMLKGYHARVRVSVKSITPRSPNVVDTERYSGASLNGLLRKGEPASPYRHGCSIALVMPMRGPATIPIFSRRAKIWNGG